MIKLITIISLYYSRTSGFLFDVGSIPGSLDFLEGYLVSVFCLR